MEISNLLQNKTRKSNLSAQIFDDFKFEVNLASELTARTLSQTLPNSSFTKKEEHIVETQWDKSWAEHHKELCKEVIPVARLEQLRSIVTEGVRRHAVFSMYGNYFSVRKALMNRGWLEKVENAVVPVGIDAADNDQVYDHLPVRGPIESKEGYIKRCERFIMALFLKDCTPDLFWNYRLGSKDFVTIPRSTLINRLLFTRFSTKAGLCSTLGNIFWHTDPNTSLVHFPRCYNISDPDENVAFQNDFRVTASMSLLKTFLFSYKAQGNEGVMDPTGTLPLNILIHAIKLCHRYLAQKRNEDIDDPLMQQQEAEDDDYLENCYMFVHKGEKFVTQLEPSLAFLEKAASSILLEMYKNWPQFDIDGRSNIWIVKPAARCRGIGIVVKSKYSEIETLLAKNKNQCRYVCQKYIETPLLIHGHKFDIRQWFLVTSVEPLTIWMYNVCYFRLSSKKFSLKDFHESVHLTNNSIQHKYKNLPKGPELPSENMWTLDEFKAYLHNMNKPIKFWESYIYPQIKKLIVGTLLCSEEHMDTRPNCFQMFGADIMIDSTFTAWLIEINSCPQMGPTCEVTKKLCPECLEDVIKVVVDRRLYPNANTGRFELIYKSQPFDVTQLTSNLEVVGKRLTLFKDLPIFNSYRTPPVISVSHLQTIDPPPRKDIAHSQSEFEFKMDLLYRGFLIDKNVGETRPMVIEQVKEDPPPLVPERINKPDDRKRLLEIEKQYDLSEKLNFKRVYPLHVGRAMIEVNAKSPIYRRKKLPEGNKLPEYDKVVESVDRIEILEKMMNNFKSKKVKTLYQKMATKSNESTKNLKLDESEKSIFGDNFAAAQKMATASDITVEMIERRLGRHPHVYRQILQSNCQSPSRLSITVL